VTAVGDAAAFAGYFVADIDEISFRNLEASAALFSLSPPRSRNA
jgi:hypothetical protein